MQYLFLLSWRQGSDSTAGENTNVHCQDDLLAQFLAKNDNIFALLIENASEDVANAIGCQKAFFDNYTAYDSVSTIISERDSAFAEALVLTNVVVHMSLTSEGKIIRLYN